MKKIGALILAALCAFLPIAGTAAQEGVTIVTVVPGSHTLTITCGEGGGIIVEGQRRTGTFTVAVDRLGTLSLLADPDDGWALNQVAASADAGVQIAADGTITLTDVYEDKTLTVSFRKLPEPTPTATVEPKPTPTATTTVEPVPTPTATTTVEPVPTPTATTTDEPVPTPTATTTVEPTPTPTATTTVEPVPTPTPTATTTVEPVPTPTPTATTTVETTPTPTATVEPTPTPTATTTVEPVPVPTPTATTTVEPVPTPMATATVEPMPTATAEPAPVPTPTRRPSSPTTPKPTATATAEPTATPTAMPEPTPTATAAFGDATEWAEPLDNVLYDEYLGTGEGVRQLSIVFDEEYAMEDYELLPIVEDDTLLVCAKPDEDGLTASRSLILSALQIERLRQDSLLEKLVFRNGDMLVTADMPELCTGRVAGLIQMGLSRNLTEIEPEALEELTGAEPPEAELTAAELAQARIEVCVVPVTLESGREGYSVQVFLRMRDERLDVSAMIESLAVNLAVTALAEEEGFEQLARRYSVAAATPEEAVLKSELRILPEERPEESERFDVTIPEDVSDPIVLYSESTALRPYETIVMTAPYAGPGIYMLVENELPGEAERP